MDPKLLKSLFGTDDIEKVLEDKKTMRSKERALISKKTSLVKLTPEECKSLCDKNKIEYLDGYESRVIQYTITDNTVDRYGDIVEAKGVDLKNYKKNPVVLAFHNGHTFPVGSSLKTWYEASESAVKAWVMFLDERVDTTKVSDTAFRFAKSGAMRTGSIGFMPLEYYYPNEKEREKLNMPQYGVHYLKSELLEFTVCPLPANPNAEKKSIQESIKRGVFSLENIQMAKEEKLFDRNFLEKLEEIFKQSLTKAEKYDCECIDCGYKLQSEEHCKDLKCPECGGQMRREERPGPGQDNLEPPAGKGTQTIEHDVTVKLEGFQENIEKLIDAISLSTNKQILMTEKLDMFVDSIKQGFKDVSESHPASGGRVPEPKKELSADTLIGQIEDVFSSFKNN